MPAARATAQKKSSAPAKGAARAATGHPQAEAVSSILNLGTCPCGGGCPQCNTQPPVRLGRLDSISTHSLSEIPASVHATVNSPGRPLDTATRHHMENRFGASTAGPPAPAPRIKPPAAKKGRVSRQGEFEERSADAAAAAVVRDDRASSDSAPFDFSRVRIHTDAPASASAHDLHATAYTVGHDIVFGAGRYAPGTLAGRHLLAHELSHVIQQGRTTSTEGLVVQRQHDGSGQTAAADAAAATLSVSLSAMIFTAEGRTFREGGTRGQAMGLILRRLLGQQYRPGLEEEVFAELARRGIQGINDLSTATTAHSGQQVRGMSIDIAYANELIAVLENVFHFTVALTPSQRELLTLGLATRTAYQALRTRNQIPLWYSEFIFAREMAQNAPLLRTYHETTRTGTTSNDDQRTAALQGILGAIGAPIAVVEAIRRDFAIGGEYRHTSDNPLTSSNRLYASVAYCLLWKLSTEEAATLAQPPPDTANAINEEKAVLFLSFLHTQPGLLAAATAADGHDARVTLLGRFGRFLGRVVRGAAGDERLLNHPARANAPAWHAHLTSSPQLQPPLYSAALETDHTFTMGLEFGDVFDAFALYVYRWEFIRVPPSNPSSPGQPVDLEQAAGQSPSLGQVLDARLRRAYRYNATDVERVRNQLGGLPFGQSAMDLVQANNALRVVGTVIRALTQRATAPSWSTQIVFPSAGLYIVRCRALPVLEGQEEVVHMPSVALLPVVAQDPDAMAVEQVRDTARTQFQAQLRLAEIQGLLASPFPPPNRDDLQREMTELQAMLADPGQALSSRRESLDQQITVLNRRLDLRRRIAAIEAQPEAGRDSAALADLHRQLHEAGGDEGNEWDESHELSSLQDQRSTVQDTIERRDTRNQGQTGLRETPLATFVSDIGQSLSLTLELYDHGEVDGQREVYLSDLTTPDSGHGLGHAAIDRAHPRQTRAEAIKNAVKTVLETSSDYGRGRVAIRIDGDIVVVPIQAGTGRMLSEALESGVTVLSLAAIAAAPFTEGASLYLLLPLGAAGAVPSAYRLYNRYDAHTLRFDLATAMDVVNIVGGVVGLAQAATPLRMVRMARFLMVMGVGADGAGILLMGAGVVEQIDALQGLPESERAARLLEILGGAMLQIGIQAGGAVAHARYGPHASGGVRHEGGGSETRIGAGEERGFHPPTDEARVAPTTDATLPPPVSAGDRTTSGAGRPPHDTPLPPPRHESGTTPSPPPPGSPEHLFGRLEQGVDRSLPPPRPASEVAHPPPRGDFRRGLRSADAAYHAYNEALAVSAGREVAIYHNAQTGEYVVRIGDEHGVSAPGTEPGWDALVHYHPNPGNVLTYRLPAPADFQGLIMRYVAEGRSVREFIEFDIPGVGRGRTEYGIQPGSSEPFYVRIHQPDGTSRTVRFAHDGAYHAYWGERTTYVEPGSPAYERMVHDISDYLRSRESSSSSTQAGTAGGATGAPTADPSSPHGGDRSMSSLGRRSSSAEPRQTGLGDLTTQGIAFIRRRFRTVREGGRSIRLDTLTDAQISERFPNQPSWLEALALADARSDWLGRTTTTDFVMADPTQTLRQVATRLQEAATAGHTGHTVHEPILEWSVWDFVREMLSQHDPTLEPAYNACAQHPDAAVRRRWREFTLSQGEGDMAGFFLGRVGDKRPDLVEVFLSRGEIAVTDITFAYNDPIHNFKTAFYRTVLERLIPVTVTGTEYRSPLRQTPIGP